MKPFIVILLGISLLFLWIFIAEKKDNLSTEYSKPKPQAAHANPKSSTIREENVNKYTCKGKVYCSEMTSCEEAMFYQRNCPGTKMDGDGDGIPCESQWCGH